MRDGTSHTGRRLSGALIVIAALSPTSPVAEATPGADAAHNTLSEAPANPGDAPPSTVNPEAPIADPVLLAAVHRETDVVQRALPQTAPNASTSPESPDIETQPNTVDVEVVTGYGAGVEAAVGELGGTVVGTVPGHLVQARLPADAVVALALSDGVTAVRSPRQSSQRPEAQPSAVGFGGNVGANVAATAAAPWHTAGIDGSGVRVGIVDYFSVGQWNATEMGPLPTVANGRAFCRDTSPFPELIPRLCLPGGEIDTTQGDTHGLAVAEGVKDMAPGSEIFIASVGTNSDLRAAIDWFAANNVLIITRSLGSAYDGPGDGTGPLAALVDYAASFGIVWFNSAGNTASGHYMRVDVPGTLGDNAYVDFDEGPGSDTWLRFATLSDFNGARGIWLDGVRWSDWSLPLAERSNYQLEFYQSSPGGLDASGNPTAAQLLPSLFNPANTNQAFQQPLEAADLVFTVTNNANTLWLRIKKLPAAADVSNNDVLEIGLTRGTVEFGYADTAGSAARAVVDSRNPSLVAVGAVDPPLGSAIASYSSRGPTNDGRIKPDVSAASGYVTVSRGTFSGTSAASPTAAGAAALLLDAELALPGPALAGLLRSLVNDLGPVGPDTAFGTGKVLLGTPPSSSSAGPAAYTPIVPQRVLDTRITSPVGAPSTTGPHPPHRVIHVPVGATPGIAPAVPSAVAVTITSVDTLGPGFVQAIPKHGAQVGATSTLNVALPGAPRPNFAVVPVGVDGSISLYLHVGGNLIVDVLGFFAPVTTSTVAAGRFVPISPERWTDTREAALLPTYPVASSSSRPLNPAETVTTRRLPGTAIPSSGVAALVVNITGTDAVSPGFLRAQTEVTAPASVYSTVNVTPGTASASGTIVPIASDGTISVYAHTSMHVVVDVVGYITSNSADAMSTGLFQSVPTTRVFDSRSGAPLDAGGGRNIDAAVPPSQTPLLLLGAVALSANLTVTEPTRAGWLKAFSGSEPSTSTVNYAANQTVANGAFVQVSGYPTVILRTMSQTHVVVDINGYFTP
jgi:hypothetical protein